MSDPLQNTRILIIDDDPKLCRLIANYLQPLGYSVAAEHSGPAGLNRALTEYFDGVLLDVSSRVSAGSTYCENCESNPPFQF